MAVWPRPSLHPALPFHAPSRISLILRCCFACTVSSEPSAHGGTLIPRDRPSSLNKGQTKGPANQSNCAPTKGISRKAGQNAFSWFPLSHIHTGTIVRSFNRLINTHLCASCLPLSAQRRHHLRCTTPLLLRQTCPRQHNYCETQPRTSDAYQLPNHFRLVNTPSHPKASQESDCQLHRNH